MAQKPADHIREIESAVLDLNRPLLQSRDEAVLASWKRCVEKYRLDPGQAYHVPVLTEAQLRAHQGATDRLIALARPGIEHLYKFVGRHGHMVSLLDGEGVIVDYIGDRSIEPDAKKARLHLGSLWSEEHAGTCAGGSCIALGEALTVHHSDHFDVRLTSYSCSAVPIYDPIGKVMAVLNITALTSPASKTSQDFGLRMVKSVAARIENANLLTNSQSEWVLQLSRDPESVATLPEGAVALDASGRIIGATHSGRKLLAQGGGFDWKCLGSVVGRPISDFVEIELDDLPGLSATASPENRFVRGRSGGVVFANAVGRRARSAPRRARAEPGPAAGPFAALSGGDPAMAEMVDAAARLGPAKLSVFIEGETGTGKERLARAIHEAGRPAGRFVPVNCAALPEALIEGELFGYAPGAFTGASAKGRKGLIEEADGGTLFLDEIGDMPLALQARLLRVLSEGEVLPLGSHKYIKVNVRFVSATHQDLLDLIDRRLFREDLYHRLAGATLRIPPLREREDFDWLVDKLVLETDRPDMRLSAAARADLGSRTWTGNIRELKNVLNLAAVVSKGTVIEVEDIASASSRPARIPPRRTPDPIAAPPPVEPSSPPEAAPGVTGDAQELKALLDRHAWNVSELARELKLDRSTLHRRMKKFHLVSPNRLAFTPPDHSTSQDEARRP